MSLGVKALRGALMMAVSMPLMLIAENNASAQGTDLGTLKITSAPKPVARKPVVRQPVRVVRAPVRPVRVAARPAPRVRSAPVVVPVAAAPVGPALSNPNVIGTNAPAGSAPALALAQAPLNIAQPTTVISDKVLRDVTRPGTDFTEAVKLAPSIATANSNGMGETKVTLRGFQDGEFNITFDNIPFQDVNSLTHHSSSFFTAWQLGKIMVDRGPGYASTLGYSTFGGTLGLFSRDLKDKMGARAEVNLGTHATRTFSGEIQSGIIPATGGKLMASFSHATTNGVQQYGGNHGAYGALKYEQPLGDNVKVTAFTSFSKAGYNNPAGITDAELAKYGKDYARLGGDPTQPNWYNYNHREKKADFSYLGIEADLGWIRVDNKLYTYSYSNFEYDASPQDSNPPSGVKYTNIGGKAVTIAGHIPGFTQLNSYRSIGNILKLSHDFNNAGFLTGTARGGLWLERFDNRRYQHNIDLTNGIFYNNLPDPANTLTAWNYDIQNSKMKTIQPFFEYEWRPIAGLTITPGFKHVDFQRHEIASMEQTTKLPVDTVAKYSANLPFFSANYRVTEEISVYAQYAKGFLAPNVNILYVPDPTKNNAQPQRSTNYQIGAVYKSNNLTIDGDLYYIDFSNKIASSLCGTQTCFTNIGGVTYKGLEISATYAFGNSFGGFADGFGITGGGSINSAKIKATGLWAPNAPNFIAFAGLVYDNPTGLFGSLTTKWVGSKYAGTGQVATSEANKLAAYNVTDATIGYRFPKNWTGGTQLKLRGGVNNIFDVRPAIDSSPVFNAAQTALGPTSTFIYNAGRTFYVSIGGEF